jgi:predicted ATPase
LPKASQGWIEATSAPFSQNTPFYPVSELLQQLSGLHRGNDSANGAGTIDHQLAQLESSLVMAGLKPGEAIPLIAPLLNLFLMVNYLTSALRPKQQRRRLLATLVNWLLGAARRQALMIATEDLHWSDASTL